jgi:tetratricopeptide (TPR) repeat protein
MWILLITFIEKSKKTARLIGLLAVTFLLFLGQLKAADQGRISEIKRQITERVNDTANIRLYMELADSFEKNSKNQLDSSLYFLNEALLLSERTDYLKHLFEIYNKHGELFFSSGNYPISLEYYFKMLQLLDEQIADNQDSTTMQDKYIRLFTQIGTCYFNMNYYDKALTYYKQSLKRVEKIKENDEDISYLRKMVILYTNIGSAYLSQYDTERAQLNFVKALEYNASLKNPDFDASLYNNMGIICKERKEYSKAFQYYNKSLEIRIKQKDTAGMAQTNNNLGNAYILTGDYKMAIGILNSVLEMSKQTHSLITRMKASEFISGAYEKQGNYAKALEMHKLFKTLQDSIINNEQVKNALRLELQYQYEKQRKIDELQKQIVIAHKERKALIYMIISAVLLFSFVIVILLNRNQRIKMKQGKLLQESLLLESRNLSLEKQNLIMEKQNLEMELEFRNKELSTHVMYLFKKNEFISSIISKLLAAKSKDNSGNNVWIMEILREMQSNVDNTVWEEFERRFQQVHEDFYEKLRLKYPDLTPNEIKICAFMKLNMTTKDISAITFQSVKSIQVARNRMRKKMGITRDENLISIIQQL